MASTGIDDREPSLESLLSDPICVALMRYDRLDPDRVRRNLRKLARRLPRRHGGRGRQAKK